MPRQIVPAVVEKLLQPTLGEGSPLLAELGAEVTRLLLQDFADPIRRRQSRRHIREYLFSALYARLGSAMLLQQPSGRCLRVSVDMLDRIAEACCGLILAALPDHEMPESRLRDLAMGEGSISAMVALLHRCAETLPAMERQILARILQENGVWPAEG